MLFVLLLLLIRSLLEIIAFGGKIKSAEYYYIITLCDCWTCHAPCRFFNVLETTKRLEWRANIIDQWWTWSLAKLFIITWKYINYSIIIVTREHPLNCPIGFFFTVDQMLATFYRRQHSRRKFAPNDARIDIHSWGVHSIVCLPFCFDGWCWQLEKMLQKKETPQKVVGMGSKIVSLLLIKNVNYWPQDRRMLRSANISTANALAHWPSDGSLLQNMLQKRRSIPSLVSLPFNCNFVAWLAINSSKLCRHSIQCWPQWHLVLRIIYR